MTQDYDTQNERPTLCRRCDHPDYHHHGGGWLGRCEESTPQEGWWLRCSCHAFAADGPDFPLQIERRNDHEGAVCS